MILEKSKQYLAKHPEYKYILFLFLATRIVLTAIGTLARTFIKGPHNFVYSKFVWLAIWGVWDSGWYLPLAKYGYSNVISNRLATAGQANYAFFPLYPLLMNLLEKIVRDYYISGLLVANLSLIIACVYLYKLARLDFDHSTAIRSIQYCLLWPVAFIFSGVFTESLYLAFAVAAFYYARKKSWLSACALGFFLALTRSLGVLIILPLLYEYLKTTSFDYKNIGKETFYFLLIPAGVALFSYYNYILTGDALAFLKIQYAWGRHIADPLRLIWGGLFHGDINSIFNSIFTLAVIALVIIFYKRIRASYLIFAAYSVLVPLLSGLESMPRYMLVIFPLFILLAQVSKNRFINYTLSASLFLVQCALMVFWTTGFNLIK